MFSNPPTTGSTRRIIPIETPVSNWNVYVYRKSEPISSFQSYDTSYVQAPQVGYVSFYIQLQQPTNSSSSNSSVLYLRYLSQQQRSTHDSCTYPFTISVLDDTKLSPETAPSLSTTVPQSSRFYNVEQQTVRKLEKKILNILAYIKIYRL